MEYNLLDQFTEPVKADYRIYRYIDGLYKVVKFHNSVCVFLNPDKETVHHDHKLDASLSRARKVVLELALCNDWKYFCTFTIAKEKFDRKDLSTWHKSFSQWLRDQRKKNLKLGIDVDVSFILVPERHDDGSWHMHGLFSDITPLLVSFRDLWLQGENVPYKLVEGGYFNWKDYQVKFGFCSFGLIKDRLKVSFYILKYITKSLQKDSLDVGLHLYYCSRGLNRSELHGEVYGQHSSLDSYLSYFGDFCDTGFARVPDESWTFALQYMDFDSLEPLDLKPDSAPDVDAFAACTQILLDGW